MLSRETRKNYNQGQVMDLTRGCCPFPRSWVLHDRSAETRNCLLSVNISSPSKLSFSMCLKHCSVNFHKNHPASVHAHAHACTPHPFKTTVFPNEREQRGFFTGENSGLRKLKKMRRLCSTAAARPCCKG